MAGTTKKDEVRRLMIKVPLTIDAVGSLEITPGGDQGADQVHPLFVIARIVDQLGNGVSGLKQSNFSVIQTGFQYKPLKFASTATQFTAEPAFEELKKFGILPGTYALNLIPGSSRLGQFSLALVVAAEISVGKLDGEMIGQALIAVVKLR
jgi:hypothetical protein